VCPSRVVLLGVLWLSLSSQKSARRADVFADESGAAAVDEPPPCMNKCTHIHRVQEEQSSCLDLDLSAFLCVCFCLKRKMAEVNLQQIPISS
jgi:hypothetical protein